MTWLLTSQECTFLNADMTSGECYSLMSQVYAYSTTLLRLQLFLCRLWQSFQFFTFLF